MSVSPTLSPAPPFSSLSGFKSGPERKPQAACGTVGAVVRLRAGAHGACSPRRARCRSCQAPVSPLYRRSPCSRAGSNERRKRCQEGADGAVHPPARSRGTSSGLLEATKCRICIIRSVLLSIRFKMQCGTGSGSGDVPLFLLSSSCRS